MTSDLIVIKAMISLKRTEHGGRRSGIKSGYRPNHVFELPQSSPHLLTYIGEIIFNDPEWINPGDTKMVIVRFLKTARIEQYMRVGQKWFINEGRRTVGFGEILEIVSA